MLLLSLTLIFLSFGMTFLLVCAYVLSIAIRAQCDDIDENDIVVLGKKLINNQPDKDYRLRLNRALKIVSYRTNANIYILGGITGESAISESAAGKLYLEDNNIKVNNIYIEELSKDTLDNMKQLKVNACITKKRITLITNRYHLARASIMAQGFGFIVKRCGAEDCFKLSMQKMISLLAEAFFLHWYLTGKYFAIITRDRRMLARIQ